MARFIVHHPTRPTRTKTVKEADLSRYVAAGWVPFDPPLVGDPAPELVTLPTAAPPSGPISEVLAWVGESPARAEMALAVEHAESARKTLIRQLEQIADGDTNDPRDGEKEPTS